MPLARDAIDQIRHLLRPLRARIANTVARAVVKVVADADALQRVQLRVLDDEVVDDGERFQEYGFSSVPLPGAEAVVVFPDGDRGHPLVVAVDDRRHRPTGRDPGDVLVYSSGGAMAVLKVGGDIEITAAPGGKVLIHDGAGGYEPLVTKSQYDAHTHPTGVGPSGPPDNAASSGTTTLEAK